MSEELSQEGLQKSDFVHLHVHTQYSVLQGAIRVKPLLEKAKALGMPAVAMTDTNNLFGAVDFYLEAKKAGIKPILGCEILYTHDGRMQLSQMAKTGHLQQEFKPRYYQLVLLCENMLGYRNLCKMLTRAYVEAPEPVKGQPAWPRAFVSESLLKEYSEGLICLAGSLRTEMSYLLLKGETEAAENQALLLKKIFGDRFYFELVDSGIPEQEWINETLYEWGKKHHIRSVMTSDCHYLNTEDADAQEVLQCIDVGRNLDIDRPKSLVPSQFYFKSAEEMKKRGERYPEALEESLKIAERCNVEFQFEDSDGKPIYHLPNYRPDGVSKEDDFDLIQYFRVQCEAGLEKRLREPQIEEIKAQGNWEEKEKEYRDRLNYEIDMIIGTGFAGYFLIVADFINWAKENGIPVGPGRGSGAGSIVAYSLRITNIDPIQFQLLFERFINPERISMPDFDVDFCQDRRGEVIDYVSRKYGVENVCQIITFGKLQARAVLRDVGRVLGLSFTETDQITKLLPDELNIKLKSALEKEPALGELIDRDSKVKQVFDYALKLEGLYRNPGIHAAGVIITEDPVVNYCPLFAGKDGDVVTQFDKDFAEKIGLVKFDFLGLKTLTVIDNAVKLVQSSAEMGTPEKHFSIETIRYDDQKVFDLVSSGDTDGVFQVESSGMKDLCSRLRPNSVEDLTAINALYRPGPLGSGMVDDFIERKHGRKPIEYELPILEPILKDTYGVILYQEQVMQIARELAGYSLGQADMLRRAMGKKKADEMARHREIFLNGAKEKNLPEKSAATIYDLMAKFAEYGFNKSHSAAYAVLTYQTAYLKTYYPAEFMAALMTTEMDNTDKLTKYIQDAKAHDIEILPPDVNQSMDRFSVEKKKDFNGKIKKGIRFGLAAIKGVGGAAVESIIAAREGRSLLETPNPNEVIESGPFKNVVDLTKRVSTRKVNKKVLEALTMSGALDQISEVNRASLFVSLEGVLEHAADEQAERELGQSSLFDAFSAEEIKLVTPTDALFKSESDWPLSLKLVKEKQVVGFYVSGHPMDSWQTICDQWLGWSIEKIKKFVEERSQLEVPQSPAPLGGGFRRRPKKEVRVAGLMTSLKEITTKKGSRMAFGELEDLTGKIEVVFFPDTFEKFQEIIRLASNEAEAVIVHADVEIRPDEPAKLLAKGMVWAKDAHEGRAEKVTLNLNAEKVSIDQLRELKQSLHEFRGKCTFSIQFNDPRFKTHLELPETTKVSGTPQFVTRMTQIFGPEVVEMR